MALGRCWGAEALAMRIAALLLAFALLPIVAPQAAANPYDACSNSVTHPKPCLKVEITQLNQNRAYYVYVAAAGCADKMHSTDCRGEPNPNRAIPAGGLWGFAYEETNRYPGLQRFAITHPDGSVTPPDRMLLF